MKKLLTLFAFALVTFTVDAQSTQKGDINGDGDISVNDVAMIVKYILGMTDSNFIIANADINGDGEIDINDVMSTVSTILEGNGGGGNGGNGGDTSQAYLTCPDDHHPHLIDLGLPSGTKWACCNVGADKPEAYGGYYAWGETEEKSRYYWDTYIHCDGSFDTCHNLGSDIAGTQYDVAHVKWGGSWVMPSFDQIYELTNNCTTQWTTQYRVEGRTFTGPSGGTIFLPAAGSRWDDVLISAGFSGHYWSSWSSIPSFSDYDAYRLYFDPGHALWGYLSYRYYGQSVRPVSK